MGVVAGRLLAVAVAVVGLSAAVTAQESRLLRLENVAILCVTEPCPRFQIRAAAPDGSAIADDILYRGVMPPIRADNGDPTEIEKAWREHWPRTCLVVSGHVTGSDGELCEPGGPCPPTATLVVERLVGQCEPDP